MASDAPELVVAIKSVGDIVSARLQGRLLAATLGFSASDLTVIATAISEVARNIVEHAGRGEIRLARCQNGSAHGVRVVARDQGPGIPDVQKALLDGYSTRRGLGLGLPGARRLMDEFEIVSSVGRGTTVRMTKWAH
jgi:serine/threonine-protein kinase RsbT